jgi:6-phosphogluconolactonase
VKDDGTLDESNSFIQHSGSSTDPKRQQGPHAHSVNYSSNNRFVIAADLGLDEVLVYKIDADKCTLAANDPPFAKVAPGSGPRHYTFHPKGKYAYVINELKSTVTAFTWDEKSGVLKEIQTISTLPEGFKEQNYTAEVVAHPSGKFLYGSNRGHNSLAVFTIDANKGTLTTVDHVLTQGKTPRNFTIDPTGAWLFAANQDSNNVVIFKIDQQTGKLTPSGQQLEMPSPVCVRFVATD